MMTKRLVFHLMAILLAGTAYATTWGTSEKTNPLTGQKVASQEIMSYGNYIYNWDSKYDLVFWPLTDVNQICFDSKNGYAAFNDDFEKVSEEEKKPLTEWLTKNYKPSQAPKSHKEKLAWLEKVYRQRKMEDDFWCRFYRLMAYVWREDRKMSMEYVRKAIPLLESELKAKPRDTEGNINIQVLFLLGEYYRRTGEAEKSKQFFDRVKTAKYKDEEGKEQVGHPYFCGLVRDREQPPKENKPDTGSNK